LQKIEKIWAKHEKIEQTAKPNQENLSQNLREKFRQKIKKFGPKISVKKIEKFEQQIAFGPKFGPTIF
jgi:hypothetical protein